MPPTGYLFALRLVEFLFDTVPSFFALNTFIVPRPEGDLLFPYPIKFFWEVRSIIVGLNDPTVGVR